MDPTQAGRETGRLAVTSANFAVGRHELMKNLHCLMKACAYVDNDGIMTALSQFVRFLHISVTATTRVHTSWILLAHPRQIGACRVDLWHCRTKCTQVSQDSGTATTFPAMPMPKGPPPKTSGGRQAGSQAGRQAAVVGLDLAGICSIWLDVFDEFAGSSRSLLDVRGICWIFVEFAGFSLNLFDVRGICWNFIEFAGS